MTTETVYLTEDGNLTEDADNAVEIIVNDFDDDDKLISQQRLYTFDDIGSLHAKNQIAMQQVLQHYVPKIPVAGFSFWPQPESGSTYYPKRSPKDGWIDSSWTPADSPLI